MTDKPVEFKCQNRSAPDLTVWADEGMERSLRLESLRTS